MFLDDQRGDLERERPWLEREDAERAAPRSAVRPGTREDARPDWWRALESSWRDHRAALAEDGPAGVADMYLDGGRRRWEITGAVMVVLALVLAVLGLVLGSSQGSSPVPARWGGLGSRRWWAGGFCRPSAHRSRPTWATTLRHCRSPPGNWPGCGCGGEVALLMFGFSGSRGARLGWVVTGAVTVVMVWAGTTPHISRWTAAGVAVFAWSVLSILAFHGAGRGHRLIIASDAPDRSPPTGGQEIVREDSPRTDGMGSSRRPPRCNWPRPDRSHPAAPSARC